MNKFIIPIRIITDLVILTVAALELKDKIWKSRMKREHASPIDQNGKEQV